jgi:hypothetical protein
MSSGPSESLQADVTRCVELGTMAGAAMPTWGSDIDGRGTRLRSEDFKKISYQLSQKPEEN